MRLFSSPNSAQRLTALHDSSERTTPLETAQNASSEKRVPDAGANGAPESIAETAMQRFLQSTLDALTAHVAVLDESGIIVAVNRAWQRFIDANGGTALTCGVGANYLAVCDDHATGEWAEEAPAAAQGLREVLAGLRSEFSLEYPCHSPSEQRWFILRVTPFEGDGPIRAVVSHEDITERKLAERTLRESEENYRRIVEMALEGVWVLDGEFHTEYVNAQMAAMLGYGEEEMTGLSPLHLVFAEDITWMERKLQQCRYGFHFQFDGRYRRKDGSELWLLANIRPLWEEGNFIGGFGMFTDITTRKQAEQQQATVLQRLHAVVTAADELLTHLDRDILVRRAVELARERLELERCSIYVLQPGDPYARGTYGTDMQGRTTDERSLSFDRSQHWTEALLHRDYTLPEAQRWFLDAAHPLVGSDPAPAKPGPHPLNRTGWVVATPILSAHGPQGVLFNDAAISGKPLDASLQEIVVVYCSLLGNIMARQHAEEAPLRACTALAQTPPEPDLR